MTIPQIAALSVAFAAFAGLIVTSKKFRIRPWIVLIAGISGIALALLVNILVHKTNSLGSLAVGVLLICVAGALLSLMANMVVQSVGRRSANRDLHVTNSPFASKHDSAATEAPSDGLAAAQINEIALLSGYTSPRPPLMLITTDSTDAAERAVTKEENTTLEEMERLERGFKLELERLEHEQEKQREQAHAAIEEQERQALKEEERRMKEEQIKLTNEAQLVRERIKRERERVAQEDSKKLEEEQAALAEKAEADLRWAQEEERLARELEERRREQEKAADAEKLWIEEQKRLALEQERLAMEKADRLAKEEAERLVNEEAQQLANEEAERLAKEEAERLATETAEQFAKEEAERLAKEEAERLATETAGQLAKEEAERLAREEAERLEAQNALEKRLSEAGEYMRTAMKLVSTGLLVEALAWMEKAARLDTTNEMKVSNNLVIVETLMMLGWKNEALKKMQTMKTTLVIDATAKKKLGELATRLLS